MQKEERIIPFEFLRISVSSQGQLTLPKSVREHLGLPNGSASRVNLIIHTGGSVVIEPEPTVDNLFGILKSTDPKTADNNEVREVINNANRKHGGYRDTD